MIKNKLKYNIILIRIILYLEIFISLYVRSLKILGNYKTFYSFYFLKIFFYFLYFYFFENTFDYKMKIVKSYMSFNFHRYKWWK